MQIRAKSGGSPEYWENPGILAELYGKSRTEHPRNISPDIPWNMTKNILIDTFKFVAMTVMPLGRELRIL